MRPKIVVIGSSNVDFVMQVPKLPSPGETVTGGSFLQAYGGKGANQAVAAVRAGGDVTFVSSVGDDLFGGPMVESFQRDGIGTATIHRASGIPTGSALVMVDRKGENIITVASGANGALLPEHIDAATELIAGAGWIVVQMELSLETTKRILESAESKGAKVLFNFAPMHTRALPVTSAMTGLIVNEGEAEALSGLPVRDVATATEAAAALRQKGPQFVVITLGSAGALVDSPDFAGLVPGFKVSPVDTTAAGDTFCGALAVALGEDKPMVDAVRFASAAAALSVTRQGAQPSIPQRAEIDAFLAKA